MKDPHLNHLPLMVHTNRIIRWYIIRGAKAWSALNFHSSSIHPKVTRPLEVQNKLAGWVADQPSALTWGRVTCCCVRPIFGSSELDWTNGHDPGTQASQLLPDNIVVTQLLPSLRAGPELKSSRAPGPACPAAAPPAVRVSLCRTPYSRIPCRLQWAGSNVRKSVDGKAHEIDQHVSPRQTVMRTYCQGSLPMRRTSSRWTNTSCQTDLKGSSSWPSRPNRHPTQLMIATKSSDIKRPSVGSRFVNLLFKWKEMCRLLPVLVIITERERRAFHRLDSYINCAYR